MSKPKMYQLMGSAEDRKPQPVTTTFDPTIIKKTKASSKTNQKSAEANKSIGSSMANMALSASLGKDERKFRLQVAFDEGKVVTISSAASLLGLQYGTIKTYAKELGIALYDDQRKEWLHGDAPKM